MKTWDYVIIGQGLAGSVLAWQLLERERSVLVVDREEEDTSSKVAAGTITPITGRKMALSWDVDRLLPVARDFFQRVGAQANRLLIHDVPVVRLFEDDRERQHWLRRAHWDEFRPYLDDSPIAEHLPAGVAPTHGGIVMRQSGYVDVPGFLDVVRQRLREAAGYCAADFCSDDLHIQNDGTVQWREHSAECMVFCQGFEAAGNRFFDWLPYRSAKGEVLDLEIAGLESPGILNRGVWLLPLNDRYRFRAGSTYSWSTLDSIPTKEGLDSILSRLNDLLPHEKEVTNHRAGVRPIVDRFATVVGRHPAHSQLAMFNGLGSKGVLKAPWFAQHLIAHLEEGEPINEHFDLRRNF